jgi:diguanylate cyclase (GGDEF)-like protein
MFGILSGTVERAQSRNQLVLTNSYIDRISDTLDNYKNLLISERKRILNHADDDQQIIDDMRLLVESNSFFINIAYLKENGLLLSSNQDMTNVDFDFATEQEVVVSSAVAENGFLILMTYPVIKDKQVYGHLIGYIDMKHIDNMFTSIRSLRNSESWITDEQGMILKHDGLIHDKPQNISDKYFEITTKHEEIVSEIMANREGHKYFVNEQISSEVLVTYGEIRAAHGWKLHILTEFEDVNMIAETMFKIMIGVFLAMVAITIVLSRVIANVTLKPIVLLTEASESEKQVPISAKIERRSDEITRLFYSYNQMTQSLQEHSEVLEDKVNLRTVELQEANSKLYNLATTDSLTGSMNRLQIINELESIMYNLKAIKNAKVAILFIDLNNFKYYNDTFGHDIGDLLLIEVIVFLKNHVRESDYIGRYGGDEFIVILPSADEESLPRIIRNIQICLEKSNYFFSELSGWLDLELKIPGDKKLGFSIGSAVYKSGDTENVDDLIKKADEEMYLNKIRSKNNIETNS